jgi:hypothetical protein
MTTKELAPDNFVDVRAVSVQRHGIEEQSIVASESLSASDE